MVWQKLLHFITAKVTKKIDCNVLLLRGQVFKKQWGGASMRPLGICNCPFKSAGWSPTCSLVGQRCRVAFNFGDLCCCGWLPDGSPSALQSQGRLF
jgi:hypothetical protein